MDLNKLKTVASSILRDEGQELIDASSRISSTVVKACGLIINHPGKIVICGMGKSGLIAQKIAATLCSIGNKAVFLHAAEASHGDLGIYAPGDPTILISKSGSTDELVKLIPILKEFNSPLIGILGNMKSSLVEHMDIVLDASVSKEADPLGLVPTASTTLTLAIGDSIAAVIMSHQRFNHEDFAKLHPAGDLGRRLRFTVEDIMQPIDKIAIVKKDDILRKVVIDMTEKPFGAALVLNNQNLIGIITEGDLRRCLAENGDIDKMRVSEIMSSNPVSVNIKAPLRDALTLMEERKSQISVSVSYTHLPLPTTPYV